ncbi:arylesterase [Flavihumibacter profundi]|uniref:arylesterase n=1 Tax=Flavihumibacter profundi TaxID=2716883 RepID=UPI001CC33E04|nr:arylesterase [Flavihumibacter profundi]MBZ5858963.1 arylesterase [Flavihumibacter profundi]
MPRNILIYLFVFAITIWACGNNASAPSKKAETKTTIARAVKDSAKTILFFGNSLTAGYGVDQAEAFPALIQLKIDSLQLPYKVINAGLSGETSSGGLSRIDWLLKQNVDVFVLELGANDGLRGIPLVQTQKNLQAIIDRVKLKNPAVVLVLAGMQVPPNMGQVYATEFQTVYKDLSVKNKMILMPFLLEGVGGNPELNQSDGIHPTPEGHKIVANNLWEYLKPVIR